MLGRGILTQYVTRLYFADDPGLDTDPVLQLVPPDRRHTLLAQPTRRVNMRSMSLCKAKMKRCSSIFDGAFFDRAYLQPLLDVEVALAAADAGMVPSSCLPDIQAAARAENFDGAALSTAAETDGNIVVSSRNLQLTAERPPACDLLPASRFNWPSELQGEALVFERKLRHQTCGCKDMPRISTQVMPRIVTSTMCTSPHARQRATRPGPRM